MNERETQHKRQSGSREDHSRPRIIIDADACPRGAMLAARELCQKYNWHCWTVANPNHQLDGDHHVMVCSRPQEADMKIANLTRSGDIVVTADLGLAALVLGRGAIVLSPSGYRFREETIDVMLEERYLHAKHRRSGGRSRGPSPRTKDDDLRFAHELEKWVSRAGRDPYTD